MVAFTEFGYINSNAWKNKKSVSWKEIEHSSGAQGLRHDARKVHGCHQTFIKRHMPLAHTRVCTQALASRRQLNHSCQRVTLPFCQKDNATIPVLKLASEKIDLRFHSAKYLHFLLMGLETTVSELGRRINKLQLDLFQCTSRHLLP
jgi:hypothetical protein